MKTEQGVLRCEIQVIFLFISTEIKHCIKNIKQLLQSKQEFLLNTLYLPTEPNNLYGMSDYTRPSGYRLMIRPMENIK